ncbi:hypothetical protein [uncultured Roseibium sp.]|uniref:hypothetical protein n=1 Tax=uncultured Roseibium sp. TaxID=1936171 RepID=UPI00260DD370|nr:hypothetical protein [uncultured Roseibium sp.]
MSETQNNAPVAVHRDGAISVKIWRNEMETQPLPFYSVTFQRTYTDNATNKPRETHSFNGTDILKVQQLASEAYRTVAHMRAQDRVHLQQDQNQQHALDVGQPQQQNGLSQQRDAVMNAVPQNQQQIQPQGPAPELEPER